MNKSESISNIVAATIAVMKEVKGIDKTMQIGTGQNSYKGVSDQEVKKIIGDSMQKNGLAIFPTGITERTQVSEWDEETQYGKKHEQSIFANIQTTYLLTHASGEFMEIAGYGHGVDSQDKAAGKATTYALKYALLYTFMVPTGKIDDADNTHSDAIPTPQPKQSDANISGLTQPTQKPNITEEMLTRAINRTRAGEAGIWENLNKAFKLTEAQTARFTKEIQDKELV